MDDLDILRHMLNHFITARELSIRMYDHPYNMYSLHVRLCLLNQKGYVTTIERNKDDVVWQITLLGLWKSHLYETTI